MQRTKRLMKQALLQETKCPLTLDPLTIFSFLVVHSKLTWNRNYCKCISLTQEKNKVPMSIFSKSSEAQTPQDSSVRAENPLAAPAPSAPGQATPPWPCSGDPHGGWGALTPPQAWAPIASQKPVALYTLAFPWCVFWTELTMLVSLCRYGLMQLLRYFTP